MPEKIPNDIPDEPDILDLLRTLDQEGREASLIAGLTPDQLDLLAQKVYWLLRRELVIERERSGRQGPL